MKRHRFRRALLGSLLLVGGVLQIRSMDQKLKIEDLVERHLASIGTPGARASARSRHSRGSAQATFHMPKSGQIPGSAEFVSDGRMLRVDMRFGSQGYQGEQLVFDGKGVDVAQLDIRVRSHLSQFVFDYGVLMKEGLLGGAITTAWPLLDLPGRQPKLDYTGLKKVEGRQWHEVRYRAKRDSGDVQVALYFDPVSFRHAYSEYRLIVRAQTVQGTDERGKPVADTSAANDTHYKIQEWFDDFRMVDSLTLPHTYRLSFSRRGPSQAVMFDYSVALSEVITNQPVEPSAFTIQNRLGR